jgi:hypothetical protein
MERAEAERKAAARQAEEGSVPMRWRRRSASQRIRRWRNGLAGVLLLLFAWAGCGTSPDRPATTETGQRLRGRGQRRRSWPKRTRHGRGVRGQCQRSRRLCRANVGVPRRAAR